MKPFPLRLLPSAALIISLLTACSDNTKKDAPAPASGTPAFQLSSYFSLIAPASGGGTTQPGHGTQHSSRDIKGTAVLKPQELVLNFVAGTDDVQFEVDRTSLGINWTNTYSLRSRNQPDAPVFISYVYKRSNGGTLSYRFSELAKDIPGEVTIAAYDDKRQLVNGSFKVLIPNQYDPLANDPSAPRCNISLEGSFENLKVSIQ